MYEITLIPKESTLLDIQEPWVNSGREWNGEDGEFFFEEVDNYEIVNGSILIQKEATIYIYNMADFYRVKIEVLPE